MNIWVVFVYLQILDFLTTEIFLALGLHEANPLVLLQLETFGIYGLLLAKILVLALCLYAYKTNRPWPVVWGNRFYMALILWNVVAISMAPQLALQIIVTPD